MIAKRVSEKEHERDKWVAWHTAKLSRTDYKLTPYDKFMRGNKPQTAEQQAAVWRDISDRVGGRWRKFDRKRSRVVGIRRRSG